MTLNEMKAKHPVMFAEYERIKGERETFNAKFVQTLRDERDAVIAEMRPQVVREQAIAAKLKEEQSKLAEFDRQISGLIAAMGGR